MRSLLKSRFALLAANVFFLAWLVASPATAESLSIDELREMPKIDSRAHLMDLEADTLEYLTAALASHNMKWLDICTFLLGGGGQTGYDRQEELAASYHAAASR